MKKVLLLILCGICILTLSGCRNNKGQSDDTDMGLPVIDYRAQYIRTDGYHDGEEYPRFFWITSSKELQEYYEANRDKFDLKSKDTVYSDETIGFDDAIKEYDDSFFEKNDLIFILLEEGSGSIRHEVTGLNIESSNNSEKKYAIQPEIDRIIPEVGTDDMAEWHIIIEISKDYGAAASDLKEPLITNLTQTVSVENSSPNIDAVSVAGSYGQIMVYIPGDWTGEAAPVDSDKMANGNGLYGLILKPKDAAEGQIELYVTDIFAVCGTGLSEEKAELAGYEAIVGTFDDHPHWDFIGFTREKPQIVAQTIDCSSWNDDMWKEAFSILDTLVFDENVREDYEEIVWDELSENGVDEDLLIRHINKETLEYVAKQLQDLCTEIDKKADKDKDYWLTGQWYSDVTDSKQYQSVLSLGKEAMKPLFLILYKSENSGMYEWICSKALEEISGYDFSEENGGNGWSDAKEFLELFINKVADR